MKFVTTQTEVLKQDARDHVHVPRGRREALLEEFERVGRAGWSGVIPKCCSRSATTFMTSGSAVRGSPRLA